ncbi:MAG: hypothetical protein CVU81_01665, partial [Euryarchaeota archaeon HGW-Euryarchaeota-1]
MEILGIPNVTVTKILEAQLSLYQHGDTVCFILNVTNNGNIDLTNINVTDIFESVNITNVTRNGGNIPYTVEYDASSPYTKGTINFTISTIQPRESIITYVCGKISENPKEGESTNILNVSGESAVKIVNDTDSVTYTVGIPRGNVTKTCPSLVAFNETMRWEIQIMSSGSYELQNISFYDELPYAIQNFTKITNVTS